MSWTIIEIDREAIRHNVRNLRSLLAPSTKFLAVVKANAYGHGLIPSAEAALEAGADWLGVNSVTEGQELRAAKVKNSILVLGVTSPEELSLAAEHRLSLCLPSYEWWNAIQPYLQKIDLPIHFHIKLETGLHRLGISPQEVLRLVQALNSHPKAKFEGLYSHLAATEERHDLFTAQQAAKLREVHAALVQASHAPQVLHLAASAAAMLEPSLHFSLVRCGIAIYGLWPSAKTKAAFLAGQRALARQAQNFLQPALSMKSRLVHIASVRDGSIGYGRMYRVKRPLTVGVMPVGYAEGFDRHLSNKGEVLVGGVRCPVVGRVAMNMVMVDITMAKAKAGDEVVLIGRQGTQEITADEVAEKIGTINYEVVTRLPGDVQRVYLG